MAETELNLFQQDLVVYTSASLKTIYYVYIYIDPNEFGLFNFGEDLDLCFMPKYVGKGRGRRYLDHFYQLRHNLNPDGTVSYLKCKQNSQNYEKLLWLKDMIDQGYKEEVLVFKYRENLTDVAALELETKLIKMIGRQDLKRGPLLNLTDGGDGVSGAVFTDERKRQYSEMFMGDKNPNWDNRWNDQQRARASKWMRDNKPPLTEENKENLRNKNQKYVYTITSPENIIYEDVKSLKQFCKIHFGDSFRWYYAGFVHVYKGEFMHYKGWKCFVKGKEYLRNEIENHIADYKKNNEYTLIDKNGNVYVTRLLSEFCKEHGVSYTTMKRVVNGKAINKDGWTGSRRKFV